MNIVVKFSSFSLLALGLFLPAALPAAEGGDTNNGFYVVTVDGSAKIVSEDGTMRDLKIGDKYALGTTEEPTELQTTGNPPFPSFLLKKAEGKVEVKTDKKYTAGEPGKAYPFGTALKTGRKGTADFEFSPKNEFRLLPGTELTVLPNNKNPKLVILDMETGDVTFALDDFPKDSHFEIRTPLGVCGAVGTAGKTTFFTSRGVLHFYTEVFNNVVSVKGKFVQILPDGLHAGQRLEIEFDPMKRLITSRFFGKADDAITLRLWGRDLVLHIADNASSASGNAAMVAVQIKLTMFVSLPTPLPATPTYAPPPIPIKPQSPAGI